MKKVLVGALISLASAGCYNFSELGAKACERLGNCDGGTSDADGGGVGGGSGEVGGGSGEVGGGSGEVGGGSGEVGGGSAGGVGGGSAGGVGSSGGGVGGGSAGGVGGGSAGGVGGSGGGVGGGSAGGVGGSGGGVGGGSAGGVGGGSAGGVGGGSAGGVGGGVPSPLCTPGGGSVMWAFTAAGDLNINALAANETGIAVVGDFASMTLGGTALTIDAGRAGFVAALNLDGGVRWVSMMLQLDGGMNRSTFSDVTMNDAGEIYAGGFSGQEPSLVTPTGSNGLFAGSQYVVLSASGAVVGRGIVSADLGEIQLAGSNQNNLCFMGKQTRVTNRIEPYTANIQGRFGGHGVGDRPNNLSDEPGGVAVAGDGTCYFSGEVQDPAPWLIDAGFLGGGSTFVAAYGPLAMNNPPPDWVRYSKVPTSHGSKLAVTPDGGLIIAGAYTGNTFTYAGGTNTQSCVACGYVGTVTSPSSGAAQSLVISNSAGFVPVKVVSARTEAFAAFSQASLLTNVSFGPSNYASGFLSHYALVRMTLNADVTAFESVAEGLPRPAFASRFAAGLAVLPDSLVIGGNFQSNVTLCGVQRSTTTGIDNGVYIARIRR